MATQTCTSCGAALTFGADHEVVDCTYCGASNRVRAPGFKEYARAAVFLPPRRGQAQPSKAVGAAILVVFLLIFGSAAFFAVSAFSGHSSEFDKAQQDMDARQREFDKEFEETRRRINQPMGLPGRTVIIEGEGPVVLPPTLPGGHPTLPRTLPGGQPPLRVVPPPSP